ncbi:MAG: hypothetical protein R2795_24820 [Saprospiraceae bacterium]
MAAYNTILDKLEGSFHHTAGLVVAKDMLELSRRIGNFDAEENALIRISDFYGFMGNHFMQTTYRTDLQTLYERIGDREKMLLTKFVLLEGHVWYQGKGKETYPAMKAILVEMEAEGFTKSANRERIRLKYVSENLAWKRNLKSRLLP